MNDNNLFDFDAVGGATGDSNDDFFDLFSIDESDIADLDSENIDAETFDFDADGADDFALIDVDTNDDGIIDVSISEMDLNGDGIVDTITIDQDIDFDGVADINTTLIDSDFDGNVDNAELHYTDGMNDYFVRAADLDFDGTVDNMSVGVDDTTLIEVEPDEPIYFSDADTDIFSGDTDSQEYDGDASDSDDQDVNPYYNYESDDSEEAPYEYEETEELPAEDDTTYESDESPEDEEIYTEPDEELYTEPEETVPEEETYTEPEEEIYAEPEGTEEYEYDTEDYDYNQPVFELPTVDYDTNNDNGMNYDELDTFDPASADPDSVIGTPEDDMELWEPQGDTNRCAIYSQKFVIEAYTGEEVDIEYLADLAEENGWFSESYGTPVIYMDKLLEHYDVPHETSQYNTIDDLAEALSEGKKVIVAVDSDEYWYGENDDMFTPSTTDGVNHAIEVIGINNTDPDNPTVIINDSGNPESGQGCEIPLDTFMDAWEDGNNFMIECM